MDSIVVFTGRDVYWSRFRDFLSGFWRPLQTRHRKFMGRTRFRQTIVPHVHHKCMHLTRNCVRNPRFRPHCPDRCGVPAIGRNRAYLVPPRNMGNVYGDREELFPESTEGTPSVVIVAPSESGRKLRFYCPSARPPAGNRVHLASSCANDADLSGS
jgi:hypothetical protein